MNLVVERKQEQAVYIGNDIVVRVVSVSGARVKLSITAPNYLLVLREELVDGKVRHS